MPNETTKHAKDAARSDGQDHRPGSNPQSGIGCCYGVLVGAMETERDDEHMAYGSGQSSKDAGKDTRHGSLGQTAGTIANPDALAKERDSPYQGRNQEQESNKRR